MVSVIHVPRCVPINSKMTTWPFRDSLPWTRWLFCWWRSDFTKLFLNLSESSSPEFDIMHIKGRPPAQSPKTTKTWRKKQAFSIFYFAQTKCFLLKYLINLKASRPNEPQWVILCGRQKLFWWVIQKVLSTEIAILLWRIFSSLQGEMWVFFYIVKGSWWFIYWTRVLHKLQSLLINPVIAVIFYHSLSLWDGMDPSY